MRIFMTLTMVLLLQGCRRDAAAPHPSAQSEPYPLAITRDAFMEAAHNGDVETVARGLKAGMDSNTTIVEGRTPLMLAAFNGHTRIVEALLKAGAKASSADVFGRTALMYAASGPNADTVRILLRSGAEMNVVDKEEQWTALMFAAAEGQTDVVRLLLDAGADRMLKDKDGDTAENFAIKSNHKDVITLLQAPKAE